MQDIDFGGFIDSVSGFPWKIIYEVHTSSLKRRKLSYLMVIATLLSILD